MNKNLFVCLCIMAFGGVAQASQLAPKQSELANPNVGSSSSSSSGKAPAVMTVAAPSADANTSSNNAYCPVFFNDSDGEQARICWDAACNGNHMAQYALASLCDRGFGVVRDEKLAFRWFDKAACAGCIPARLAIATCYYVGIGVDKDVKVAIKAYQGADSQFQGQTGGHRLAPACFALAEIYGQLAKDEKDSYRAKALGAISSNYKQLFITQGKQLGENYWVIWARVTDMFTYMRGEAYEAAGKAFQDELDVLGEPFFDNAPQKDRSVLVKKEQALRVWKITTLRRARL